MALVLPSPADVAGRVVAAATTVGRLPDQAARLVARVVAIVDVVEALVEEIAVIAARAAEVVARADAVAVEAGDAALLTHAQLQRSQALLDSVASSVRELQPVLERGAVVLEPRHVDAVSRLLDLTPEVIDLISPALRNLGDLTPELHQLAERFEAMGQIVEGIPGSKMFKRRGASEDPEPEAS